MNNIDVREYIINNFKEDSEEEIEKAITSSIESKSEDTLIGMGVLFELMWNQATSEERKGILTNIKNGLHQ